MEEKIIYKNFSVLFVSEDKQERDWFIKKLDKVFATDVVSSMEEAENVVEWNDIAVILFSVTSGFDEAYKSIDKLRKSSPSETSFIIIAEENEKKEVFVMMEAGVISSHSFRPSDELNLRALIKQAIQRYSLACDRTDLYQEKVYTMKKIARVNRLAAVGILSAGMAHEINNPLVAISTFLQMIPDKLEDEELDRQFWYDYYSVVLEELYRIQKLTTRLVKYSTYGEDEVLKLKMKNVNEIILEMVSFTVNEARKKKVEVNLNLQEDIPDILLDKDTIKQVILNLLLNALQSFDEEGGDIFVSSKTLKKKNVSFVEISIKDTGSGMTGESLAKLFTPFFTTKDSQGSGLGLMTCHKIIDDHRGTIDVKSSTDEGSKFTILLPLDPAAHDRRQGSR